MAFAPADLPPAALEFLTERHLATLTTLRADGTPHVVPVGFTWHGTTGVAWVITDGASRKVRHATAGGPAVLCQVDGARWLALAGPVRVRREPAVVAAAEARYAVRYRRPRVNPTRVVLEIAVRTVTGSGGVSPAPPAISFA